MFFQGVLVTFSQVFIFTDHRLFNDVNFAEIGSLQEIAVKRKSAFALWVNWRQFMPKLESISRVTAELCRFIPNACGRTRPLAPLEKPFELSF